MKFPNALKDPLMDAVDSAMALIPHPRPEEERLRACRIVAHRGYCKEGAKENTVAAFQAALACGSWGIEFDIRWTSDHKPIVHHDADARRVFHLSHRLDEISLKECRTFLSEIPSLEEIIAQFGGKLHLMIELKGEVAGHAQRLSALESLLKPLEAIRDYHLIGLSPRNLLACRFLPRKALLPVGEFNARELSRIALQEGMAGLTSQYVLMSTGLIKKHHAASQMVGTGFITSRSVLFREINRGVDWVFTNHAKEILNILKGFP